MNARNEHKVDEALQLHSDASNDPATTSHDEMGGPSTTSFPVARMDSAHLQSPSLTKFTAELKPAHELKLLLPESVAQQIEQHLQPQLVLDPHAKEAAGNGYSLTTLYCDTPQQDVYLRQGRHRLFKFRIREYGSATDVYLERKSKQGTVVRKRRTSIPLQTLSRLGELAPTNRWEGTWYHHQLLRNRLSPVCLLHYQRMAYFLLAGEEPIRLTFDRNIQGALTSQWSMQMPNNCLPLLSGQVVCEFKYRGDLPVLVKGLLESLQLIPCGVSKFRHCIDAYSSAMKDTTPHV